MNTIHNTSSQFIPANSITFCRNNFNFNFQQNSNAVNNYSFSSINPSLTEKLPHIYRKRNYNDLMESYQKKQNNLYNLENHELYKKINVNFQKNLQQNIQNNSQYEKIILNDKRNKADKKKEIKLPKKFIIDDDIDDVEKDFIFEKDKKVEKKYKLSKSYLYDEESGFDSDLEDTKENSFSCLNFSFDYPEIHFDTKIKDKLITNAIELEKTFNRFFNVKNMPNKK